MQALQHFAAYAHEMIELKFQQRMRQIGLLDHDQAIRLDHVARSFREEGIWCNADRRGDALAQLLRQPVLDFERQFLGRVSRLIAAREANPHFVNGVHRRNRRHTFHHHFRALVKLNIHRWPRHHEHNLRAHAPRVGDVGQGFYAEALRLDARGNRAGGVRQHGYHRDRTTAQLGSQLLLDRGKVAVEIDVQRAKHVPILLDVITVSRVIVWLAALYARSKPRFPVPPSDAKSSPTH